MLDLANKNDVTGMFSKAGRVSYERFHILQKKDDILNEPERPRHFSQHNSPLDKIDNGFGNKLHKNRNSENNIEPPAIHKSSDKHDDKDKFQPWDLMLGRKGY